MVSEQRILDIIMCKVPFNSLKHFVLVESRGLVCENAFSKYYKLQNILNAIDKYRNKEIDCKYLSYWASAYLRIISALNTVISDYDNDEDGGICIGYDSFKGVLEEAICYAVDGLIFFDDTQDCCQGDDLSGDIKFFTFLDDMYYHLSDWELYFTEAIEPATDYLDEVDVLCINHAKKICFEAKRCFLDYMHNKVAETQLSQEEFINKRNEYIKLKYNYKVDEDFV